MTGKEKAAARPGAKSRDSRRVLVLGTHCHLHALSECARRHNLIYYLYEEAGCLRYCRQHDGKMIDSPVEPEPTCQAGLTFRCAFDALAFVVRRNAHVTGNYFYLM